MDDVKADPMRDATPPARAAHEAVRRRSRRIWLGGLCGALALGGLSPAMASFPERTIRIIIPYAPGGITDNFGRAMAEGMSRELKQPVIAENRPGAAAAIGTGFVARAPADGYTLVVATNGNLVTTPLFQSKLPFDARRDFKVISIAVEVPTVIVTNTVVPANDLNQFRRYATDNAGKVNYASLGQGNSLFLTAKMLETALGIRMTEVPYKGSVPAVTALMANEVQLYVDVLPGSLQLIRSGKLKALAVPSNQRLPWLPDVPTLAEAGYAPFHAASWLGLAVPADTPPEVVRILQNAARRAAAVDRFREAFTNAGVTVMPEMSDAEIERYIAADRERWATIIRQHDIKVE